jgi:hypothetical protein
MCMFLLFLRRVRLHLDVEYSVDSMLAAAEKQQQRSSGPTSSWLAPGQPSSLHSVQLRSRCASSGRLLVQFEGAAPAAPTHAKVLPSSMQGRAPELLGQQQGCIAPDAAETDAAQQQAAALPPASKKRKLDGSTSCHTSDTSKRKKQQQQQDQQMELGGSASQIAPAGAADGQQQQQQHTGLGADTSRGNAAGTAKDRKIKKKKQQQQQEQQQQQTELGGTTSCSTYPTGNATGNKQKTRQQQQQQMELCGTASNGSNPAGTADHKSQQGNPQRQQQPRHIWYSPSYASVAAGKPQPQRQQQQLANKEADRWRYLTAGS